METKLINFRAPIELQNTFDLVCRYKSQSRTKVLIELMYEYVSLHHQPIIEKINSLRYLNKNLSEIVNKKSERRRHQRQNETEFDVPIWDNNETNHF